VPSALVAVKVVPERVILLITSDVEGVEIASRNLSGEAT